MDEGLRALERRSAAGDADSTMHFARAAERARMPSLPIWTLALAQAPASEDAKAGYISAGGFYAESIEDEYLGSAWKLYNIPVNGELWNLIYGRTLLKGAHGPLTATVDQHLDSSVAEEQYNPGGVAMTSTLLQGSIDLAMYDHRVSPFLADCVAQYQKDQFEKEQRWRIAGKLTYNGEQATLEDITLDRTRHSRTVIVPELANNNIILAPEQSEDWLGTLANIPQNLVPLLTELYGRDYARVIPAIQYFTRRRNGNLSAVYLWTPPLNSRMGMPERALVLGRDVDGFGIDCDVGIVGDGPAVGWRSAQKISSGNEGL